MKKLLSLFLILLFASSMMTVKADTWTVAGSNTTLLDASWSPLTTANDMINVKYNEWYLLKANKTLTAGTLEYKVCKNQDWGTAYPGSNAQFSLTAGTYDVLFKFVNDNNHSVSATKVTSWTVAGTADLFGSDWNTEDTNNDMARSDNNWTLTKSHVLLAAVTIYECKVAANHAWTYAFPGENKDFTVAEDGYYDVTIDFNTSTLAVTVTTTFLEPAVLPTPTITLHSNISGSWVTSDAFAIASGDETASLTLTDVAVGSYEFGVKINDNWTSNGTAFTRANYSHAVTAGSGNCTFVADIVGDYTFTWTYESNTLSILYPDMTTKEVKFFAPRTEDNPWDQVYAFTWNGDVTYSAWPGDEITATKDAGWYSYDVPVGASVLFHDNNDMQTNDITNVQADVCYAPTAIDYEATPKKVSVAVDADCKVEYYIAGSKALIGGESDFGTFLPLDENNQIKFEDVAAGEYAFKLNINNWAWALGGNQHLSDEEGCGTIAKEVGTGDVGFAIDHTQDVTITYYPSTQKICLGAETTKSTASVTAEDMSVYVGKARSIKATKVSDAEEIQYEILSGDEYINIADGKITGVATGTATVRASVAETATYLGAYVEFTVTVSALQTAKVRFFAPRTEDNPWAQVFAYAWIDDDPQSAAWPGDEITATKNSGWYEYDAPVGASVVFTDYNTAKGLMKTTDIENVTEAKSFVPTSIYYPETPEEDKIVSLSEQNVVAYYISGSKALIGGSADFDTNLPLDANNQIVFEDVVPGTYSFKINNGSWAWAIGGNDHLKEGDCASIAATVGVGDVGFQIDTKQDITITYYPATQEICLGAETIEPIPDIEAIGGKFIINAKGDTAVFSRGNLQYKQTSDKWRCAPKQYDWKGTDNLQMGNTAYPGWVDLFSWSIGDENNYGATSAYNTSLYYNKAFVDWGSKFEGNWSTLSINEWYYLLYTRANANNLWGMAMIGDTLGMVLLPNGWTNPGGVTFVPGTTPTTNMWYADDCLDPTHADENHWRINKENLPANKFTEEEWAILEAAGAVFCPYGGRRSGGYGNHTNRDNETVSYEYAYAYYENYYGAYWTSTVRNAEEGKVYWLPMICGGCDANHENWGRGSHGWWENGRYGHSVRLVHIIPRQYTVTYDANGAEGVVPTDAAKYPDGAAITLASAAGLSKEGYVFAGWKFKGVTYNDSYTINNVLANEEIVFEAQWTLMPSVTLRDGLSDGKWGTYCPPRKVLNAEGATFYQISYLEEQAGMPYNMIFDQIEGTTLTAGKPYFFIANASEIRGIQVGDALTAADPAGVNGFYGYIGDASMELTVHHADYEATEDNTFIIYNNSVFRINQGGTMLRSERCYINISPSEPDRTPVSPAPTRRRVTMNVTGTSATTGMESVQTSEGNIQKVMIDGQLFILRGEKMYDATGRMVK